MPPLSVKETSNPKKNEKFLRGNLLPAGLTYRNNFWVALKKFGIRGMPNKMVIHSKKIVCN